METRKRNTKDISFPYRVQMLQWETVDINNKIIVRGFGVNEKGESVLVSIKNFTPYFYLKLPTNFTETTCKLLSNYLKKKIPNLQIEYKIEYHKSFYCYQTEKSRFIKLIFFNEKQFKDSLREFSHPIFISSKKYTFEIFEGKLKPILRFFHEADILPSGIILIENGIKQNNYISNCQIEIETSIFSIKKEDTTDRYPIRELSFDIECYSVDGTFPDPEIKENVITHIGLVYKQKEKIMRVCLSLFSKVISESNVTHYCYEKESDLLKKFEESILQMDPDIIYGYNSDQFDWNYVYTRFKKCNLILNLSKLKFSPCTIKKDTFSSSAYGQSEFKRLLIPGRINFDVLIYMKREFKENCYKLDYISKKYLNSSKNEMNIKSIFKSYSDRDLETSREVALYCVQDSILPQQLVDHFNIFEGLLGMSNVCLVPFNFLFVNGQQIKCFSQILYRTKKKGYVVPNIMQEKDNISFVGATVVEPNKGAYFEPIVVLDFESLYPSIIRAHNLCYSSYLPNGPIKGIKSTTFEWKDIYGDHNYTFAQTDESILPELLTELKKSRDLAKKKKKESSGLEAVIYDKLQLAYKVSMNSIYGFLSAQMLTCKCIGATVTYVGRQMIKETSDQVLKNYSGSEVIYGDSVTEYTPVLVKINNVVQWVTISELSKFGGPWRSCHILSKEYSELNNVYSWTETGWTRCYRIIRHVLHPKKRIIRTWTIDGIVDTTDDHSLLLENGTPVSPKNIKSSDKLLTSYFNFNSINNPNYLNPVLKFKTMLEASKAYTNRHHCYYDNDYFYLYEYNDIQNKSVYCSEIEYTGTFVYDLTTENHHFQAGIGKIIVHNTDSVFINFHKNPEESSKLGKEAAKKISSVFKNPINLEYEKYYYPFILLGKKTYLGNKFEGPKGKIETKGIVLNRRDNCPVLKQIYLGSIELLLENKKEESISFIKNNIKELLDGKYNINDFIISKVLNSNYKNENLPHVRLAKIMKERGKQVQINDRINYVFCKGSFKKTDPQYLRVEDPEYLQKNNKELDISYYIEKQIKNPIVSLMTVVIGKEAAESIFKPKESKIQTKLEFKKEIIISDIKKDPESFINKNCIQEKEYKYIDLLPLLLKIKKSKKDYILSVFLYKKEQRKTDFLDNFFKDKKTTNSTIKSISLHKKMTHWGPIYLGIQSNEKDHFHIILFQDLSNIINKLIE